MDRTPTSSRPLTPVSPVGSIVSNPGIHFDDAFTGSLAALRNFSNRSVTPFQLSCCCGRQDCESLQSCRDVVQKLEKELVLSAEVGQALLHRHEDYVRNQETVVSTARRNAELYSEAREKVASVTAANNQLVAKMSHLVKEHSIMEKRLAQTLLNLEVADASNRTLLHEIQEARATITRLSAQTAKAVGWEAKLSSLQQERDDLREERKAEASRARTAEAKVAALTEKCARLQSEMHDMREERENRRISKAELSEEILRDARLRLDALQVAVSQTSSSEDAEFTRVLESLVSENEALKHDNAELQNLLADSREDVRILREEVEEQRAAAPYRQEQEQSHFLPLRLDGTLPSPVISRGHRVKESWASSSSAPLPRSPSYNDGLLSPRMPGSRIRTSSHSIAQGARKSFSRASDNGDDKSSADDNTPSENDLQRAPVSPASSGRASRRTSISRHSHTPSSFSMEIDTSNQPDKVISSPPQGRRKQLLLLTKSRGTQTDPVTVLPSSPRPRSLLDEPVTSASHSDTSSFQEGKLSQIAILLEKINSLLQRISQADVRTLTNRLKRQHLAGADVGYLSRTTISGILNEVSSLRNHFRMVLDDDRSITLVSRKEFRALLKTYSELFQEIGSLRATVNEVVLNPAVANKLHEDALLTEEKSKAPKPTGALGGWIAPLSKLWTGQTSDSSDGKETAPNPGLGRSGTLRPRLQPKIGSKLAPAVSASTTTVNVEFTNAGIRRAISTTADPIVSPPINRSNGGSSPVSQIRPQLRGIFAGSVPVSSKLVSTDKTGDPWVVVQGVGNAATSNARAEQARGRGAGVRPVAVLRGRGGMKNTVDHTRRMSRAVDAMVDQSAVDEDSEEEFPSNLLQRTLRPRGLSDSSIHSTFIAHNPVNRLLTPSGLALSSPTVDSHDVTGETTTGITTAGGWLDRDAVLQSLSRKVQSFRLTAASPTMKPAQVKIETGDQVGDSKGKSEAGTPTSGTPKFSVSSLSSSPPKPIPGTRVSRGSSRADRSLSPTSGSASRAGDRQDSHGSLQSVKNMSPKTTGVLSSLASWGSPNLQRVREGHDEDAPMAGSSAGIIPVGSYRKPSEIREDVAGGRTFGRGRAL